jgi:ABC-2 type transport system permease protein
MTMRGLRNIFYLGRKELYSFVNDTMLLVFIAYAFSISIYTVARGVSFELRNAPVGIVDLDRSQLSRRIASALTPPYFMTPEEISLSEIDKNMDFGRYTFALVIPENFEADVIRGRQPELQLNIDATIVAHAGIGAGYLQTIIMQEVTDFLGRDEGRVDLPVTIEPRVMFNPNLNQEWFISVMQIINNVTLLAIILTGAALIRERERGTVDHLLVMPITPTEIMAAKCAANGLVILIAAAFALIVMVQIVLQVPIAGSVSLFLAGAAVYLFSATAIGIFLGTIARSMPQLSLLIMLTILPMHMLSGGTTPRESQPEIVQWMMNFAPSTHFIAFAQAILYRGAGLATVWPYLALVAVLGAAFFMAALLRFRRAMAAMQ